MAVELKKHNVPLLVHHNRVESILIFQGDFTLHVSCRSKDLQPTHYGGSTRVPSTNQEQWLS